METVSFTPMADGTRDDYLLLERLEKEHVAGVAGRVLRHLLELKDSFSGYQVDRMEHSLQSAARAHRRAVVAVAAAVNGRGARGRLVQPPVADQPVVDDQPVEGRRRR